MQIIAPIDTLPCGSAAGFPSAIGACEADMPICEHTVAGEEGRIRKTGSRECGSCSTLLFL